MAFIRPYQSSDFESAGQICRDTLPPSLSSSPVAVRLCAYLWTHQYTHLSPETCFVLDDGTGQAVGYCIGCADVAGFIAGYSLYTSEVLEGRAAVQGLISRPGNMTVSESWRHADGSVNETRLSQQAYSGRWLLEEGNEKLLEEGYLATMHINLLDEYQGKGWGSRLIETFVESLEGRVQPGCRGIFIGISPDNRQVMRFYEKLGFREYIKGDDSVCMVRELKW